MAGRNPQGGPRQGVRAQNPQKQPRAPAAPRAPPAEEEDPRVKCKDCGAFGHKARSTRCPMKRWDGALAPQPLGPQKMKENRQVGRPRDPGSSGPAARPAGEEQRPSPEDQRRAALLRRFPRRPLERLQPSWKDLSECCYYVRHPRQPVPVYRARRAYVGAPGLRSSPPDWQPEETSTESPIYSVDWSNFTPFVLSEGEGVPATDSRHPAGTGFVQGPGSTSRGLGDTLIPQAQAEHPDVTSPSEGHAAAHSSGQDSEVGLRAPGKRAAQSPARPCQNPPKKSRIGPCPPAQRSMPTADPGCARPRLPPASAPGLSPARAPGAPRKSRIHGGRVDLQPPHEGPVLGTVPACLASPPPPVPQRPGPPLRMVLRRVKGGQWSSWLLPTPSVLPAEEPAPPVRSPPTPGMAEAPCACFVPSVLHEDLLVSSSSEDSESE